MTKSLATVILVTACGLGGHPESTLGWFVTDVRVDGPNLVVDRCRVRHVGEQLVLDQCISRPVTLPITVDRPTLEAVDILEGIAPARPRVAECLARAQIPVAVPVKLTIDRAGRVTGAENETRNQQLTECIGNAVGSISFPPSRSGAQLVVPFEPPL